jgi:hypothetical protein
MRDLKPENKSVYEKPAIIHRELMESIAGTCDSTEPVVGKTGVEDECQFLNS